MSDLKGLRIPLPGIPKVKVVDENGKTLMTGYYVYHEARQPAPIGDSLTDDEIQHLVICDDSADWNMPKSLRVLRITPPERIEVLDD